VVWINRKTDPGKNSECLKATNDEGGITGKDFSLGEQCDEVFAKYYAFRTTRIPT
jgi:hypothetical protein